MVYETWKLTPCYAFIPSVGSPRDLQRPVSLMGTIWSFNQYMRACYVSNLFNYHVMPEED